MEARLTRRRFVSGLGAAVLVAGFDPVSRRWLSAAQAATCPSFAGAPPLDGELLFDEAALSSASRDQGNMVTRRPCAVLRPRSADDVVKMMRFCRRHGIRIAPRGQGHTTHGQALVAGGLQIESASLGTIHSIGPEGADVDAGVLWRDLFDAALQQGLTPPALTGYTKLSVGGTLSVGGVGAQTTNTTGLQMERVQELQVVTGKGELTICSPARNRDLFEAVLGGLGQFGVITRAKVDLVPAKERARTYNFNYTDNTQFFKDFRTLLYRGEFDSVYNFWFPFQSNANYQIQAVSLYDASAPPDDLHLIRGTSPAAFGGIKDSTYRDYIVAIDDVFDTYKLTGYDDVIKPWYDVWLPESTVEAYVEEVIAALTPRDIGPTGFLLILPQLRGSITRPFYPVPDVPGDEFVYLFDVLTSSALPGPDPLFAAEMLERNRRFYDKAVAAGATRYCIGSLSFSAADWKAHYGEAWAELQARKKRFDPGGILTPGPGIFSR